MSVLFTPPRAGGGVGHGSPGQDTYPSSGHDLPGQDVRPPPPPHPTYHARPDLSRSSIVRIEGPGLHWLVMSIGGCRGVQTSQSLTSLLSAGVIDQDYRGNVGVVMFNFNDQDFPGIVVKKFSVICTSKSCLVI